MPSDPTRRMRSAAVSIGLVGALALSLTGCGGTQSPPRRCIDEATQNVVPEEYCLTPTPVAGSSTTRSRYRHYYGGRVSSGRVSGGSYSAPSGKSSGSGSVQTGGFGASGGKSSSGSKSSGS